MQLPDITYATGGQRGHQGSIATITLDRPQARNAYSDEMVQSLIAAVDEAERDDEVRCIVLTGAGQAFHAGGDLKLMRDTQGMFSGDPATLRRRYVDGIQRVPRRLAACDKPVVAAINGAAIGAGLDLACMCDVRIASTAAKLGSTFVKLGLVPGDGGAYFLARVVGFPRALEMVLTGRVIEADEALAIGLVHRVVAPDALLTTAYETAEMIAANAPVAVRLTKRAAYRSWDADVETALELAATYQGIAQNTEDHRGAVEALLAKRTPVFSGR